MEIEVKELINVTSNNTALLKELKKQLEVKNPQYYKLQAMGRPIYDEPREFIMYEEKNNVLSIPRGHGQILMQLASRYNEKITKFTDNRSNGHEIDVELNLNDKFVKLHDYQQNLIDSICTNNIINGVIIMPCGAGKTVSALGLVAKMKTSTLILVHTRDLMQQWIDEIVGCKDKNITAKLTGDFECGQLGNGIKKVGDVTIGMVQTIHRLKDKDFKYLSKQFGLIIHDETHHVPSRTFLSIIKRLSSKRVYGLSATPNRKDQLQFLLYNYIGPVIHKVTDKELRALGKFVPTLVERVKTNVEFDFGTMNNDFIALTTAITSHTMRNEIILEQVEADIKAGRHPMILCNRTKHAEYLQSKFIARGYKVGILMGKIEAKVRNEYKTLAIAGELDVMICMQQIAGEGLDVPIIDTIHLPYIINNKNNLKQIIGRGGRTFKDKLHCSVKIYDDFIFSRILDKKTEHGMMTNIRRNHNKWFKEFGYDIN